MIVALCATAIVVLALLWEISIPWLDRRLDARRERRRARREGVGSGYDPGRERRAEQRARELLRSCVSDEEWGMYRDLGFIRVWGSQRRGPVRGIGYRERQEDRMTTRQAALAAEEGDLAGEGFQGGRPDELAGVPYAYLIYPHKPIVAYLPQTGRLLNEYCVEFPDETRPYGSPRLPDSDDVLAKWMALKGDERRLISAANMHLPGRQVDVRLLQRDIWRLGRWERERLAAAREPASSTSSDGPDGPGGSARAARPADPPA